MLHVIKCISQNIKPFHYLLNTLLLTAPLRLPNISIRNSQPIEMLLLDSQTSRLLYDHDEMKVWLFDHMPYFLSFQYLLLVSFVCVLLFPESWSTQLLDTFISVSMYVDSGECIRWMQGGSFIIARLQLLHQTKINRYLPVMKFTITLCPLFPQKHN